MGRTTTTRLGVRLLAPSLLSVLALTGCTGSADPAEPPPPPTTRTTPSPSPATATATGTASPAPTPPAMPPAAKAHTKAGAKAFVTHLWVLADSLGRAPDPSPMRPLLDQGCTGCQGVLDLLTKLKSGDGVLRGGSTTLSKFEVNNRDFGGQALTEVAVDVVSMPSLADYPGTTRDVRYPGGKRRTIFLLRYQASTWRVTTWQPL